MSSAAAEQERPESQGRENTQRFCSSSSSVDTEKQEGQLRDRIDGLLKGFCFMFFMFLFTLVYLVVIRDYSQ